MLLKTPLHANHLRLNAKMVDFHGWDLPLHYGSQLQEHLNVRNDAGVFDVSHMTILDILGTGGRQFLRKLLTQDVDKLPHPGAALYTCMCNEHGGILDDLIVYQRAPDSYRLILNSATKEKDIAWIQEKSEGFAVGLQGRPELAIIAVQGPHAFNKIQSCLDAAQVDAISTLQRFECVDVEHFFFARTGYTGEDGLEIILPQEQASAFWDKLMKAGIQACGLAARDSLRLEAGLLLYGQDMDESTTPLESALAWTISWEPADRNFIGAGALLSQKQNIKRKLIGLTLQDKGIMRTGQRVFVKGQPVGIITSGGYSPSLKMSIALARVPVEVTGELSVEIRDKLHIAQLSKPRFLPAQKSS